MLKCSALRIIRSFSREELTEFNDFLRSPYFNKKTGVIKLFNEIKKYYPELTSDSLDKEKLWNKLYPDKKFNYGVMKNLIFEITKLAEEFITIVNGESYEIQKEMNLCDALTKRKLNNVLEKRISVIRKKFIDSSLSNSEVDILDFYWYLNKIGDAEMWLIHFGDKNKSMKDISGRQQSINITGTIINLIMSFYPAYILSLMDKNNFGQNISGMILKSIPEEVFENVFDEIRKESEIKYKIINSYYLGYIATANAESSEYFYHFRNFFYANFECIPVKSRHDLDFMIINLFSLISDSSFEKENEYFEHFLFRFKNNLVLDKNKQLNSIQFLTWIVVFFDGQNVRNLEKFIKQYQSFINDEDKEASLLLGEAIVNFMKEDFQKCLNVLMKIKFNSILLKNALRKFTLLVYYEINEYEMFLTTLDAYKHFLNYSDWGKKEFRDYRIQRTKDVYNSIETLFELRGSPNIFALEQFEKRLKSKSIDFKKWFLSKISEIKLSSKMKIKSGLGKTAE